MSSDEDRNQVPAKRGDLAPEIAGYAELLDDLKARIREAQVRATLAVNRELVLLYWQIGREILARQEWAGWGSKVVERLAQDLRREFPVMSGLSRTNLMYMRAFADAYPDESIVQQAVGQIPWGHNTVLLDKVKDAEERAWYAQQTIEHGWSRNVLVHQIESGLYERQGQAVTNFERTLPAPQSDLARELLKDPYHFDFLELGPETKERELERALLAHLRDFLLELGVGFALVGSQYRLDVGGQEYRLDLLFYHLQLRCFVAVELKVGAFRPENAGKLNFYLAAVDDQLRREDDQPSIGLILCKERNRVVVEYALRGTQRPIGVAEYRLTERLPKKLRGSLPTPEELERELDKIEGPDTPESLKDGLARGERSHAGPAPQWGAGRFRARHRRCAGQGMARNGSFLHRFATHPASVKSSGALGTHECRAQYHEPGHGGTNRSKLGRSSA